MACWSCECSPLSLMATLFWGKFPKFFLRCTGFLRLWQQWWSWSALGPDAIEGEGVAAPDSLTMPVFVRTWQQVVSWIIGGPCWIDLGGPSDGPSDQTIVFPISAILVFWCSWQPKGILFYFLPLHFVSRMSPATITVNVKVFAEGRFIVWVILLN